MLTSFTLDNHFFIRLAIAVSPFCWISYLRLLLSQPYILIIHFCVPYVNSFGTHFLFFWKKVFYPVI